jgi:hypothetical protein
MALERQAFRAAWPISPKSRMRILRRLDKLSRSGKASTRERIMALRTILAADSLNLRQQSIDLARERLDRDGDAGDAPTAADVVRDLIAAARRYEQREREGGDRPGAGSVPDGPGPVQ